MYWENIYPEKSIHYEHIPDEQRITFYPTCEIS